ncbi:MAG: LysM peptidoglycan-binding domain-containing protein, partial [Campylobacteraceae bacterium]|nr:LysM peptidoglycan-binding domain-containing protein [Campylobacteraceae bacterium]
ANTNTFSYTRKTRLKNIIDKYGKTDIKSLLDENKKYIPKETRDYIRKILAVSAVVSSGEFILNDETDLILNQTDNNKFYIAQVPVKTSLASIAKSIGISIDALKDLNPHLKYDLTPPDGSNFNIYMPYKSKDSFENNFKIQNGTNKDFHTYIVKNGDTLYKIGRKFNIKHTVIKQFNNLASNHLKLNQKLIIPRTVYTMKQSDTLSAVSKQFSIKMSDIRKFNKFKKNIKPGDTIVIPTK